jgi:adenosine deaminase
MYKDQIVALDLAGDERNFPGKLFIDHIQEGRSAGLKITIHAGEDAGPDSIWQAVEELNADRIGHCVSAAQDPELMQYLAEKQIGVECNLTSNVQTKVVENYSSHPLKIFLEEGILATINSDDPGISGINLKYEYETAAPAAGLSPDLIKQAQKNSLEIAFLSDNEKQKLRQKAEKRKK